MRGYLPAVGLALVAALLLRGLVVTGVKVPSGSMLPTLQVGDYLLVTPLFYGLRLPGIGWVTRWAEPQPGDVVVFAGPHDTGPKDVALDYVKRVAAVGGELVEMRDGQLIVDGSPRLFPGTAVRHPAPGSQLPVRTDNFGPVPVPGGKLFMLGDSRDRSIDSRVFGFVDVNDVRGKAGAIYWSMDGDDGWVRWERLGSEVR
ncbi:MAG TPA: signal peptidase I [Candidatus Dormibacteraeota bacterium]|nr:signal peptidase I [Candidatus Dormibacteraeota bacterium]